MLRSFPRFVQVVSIVSVCALAAVAPRKSLGQGNADLIVTGGKIYTVDSRDRVAEALAIAGDRIVAVGDAREIERWAGSNTRRIDLDGKTVVPGLIDAHGHFQRMGAGLPRLSFVGTTSLREIVDKVAEQAASTSKGEWITGRGWDQNDWAETEFPHHTTLSASTPDHPVWLTRVDGHAGFANALAMELSGVTRETPDPPGGRIIRDPSSGNPTGVFIDNAQGLVARRLPSLSNDRFEESVRLAVKECLRYGLTGVHDAGVSDRQLETYKRLIDRDEFDMRIYAMISSRAGPTLARYLSGRPMIGYGNHRLTVRAIKVVVDGALGSRGAALLEPYSDEAGNVGLLTTAPDRLRSITERAFGSGFQVCAHAIGDRANRLVLDTFEAVLGGGAGALDHRFRIEHAQIITLPDIARFGPLGVIASIEATHATSDMYWAEDRVGPERIEGAYAWRRLLDAGARIANGSDFPVEGVNPLWGFYASITRQDREGWPEGGWRPEERLTRAEALRSFTLDAAYAAFEEDFKGSLEPGKLADLVVLSKDIMTIEPSEILRTEVEMTILGGRVVYEREGR